MSLGMQVRNSSAVPSCRGSGRTARSNNNIQVKNIERGTWGRTYTEHKTSRHRTQDGRRRGGGGRGAHACRPVRAHDIHADVTVSAIRSTDGSRRTFRGTGHSKIHDSPLDARTHGAGEACVRAAMLRSRTHRAWLVGCGAGPARRPPPRRGTASAVHFHYSIPDEYIIKS